jgi:hypothetical protein
MCRQVRDAANGITLHLDIGGHHLSYQWRETAQVHNQDFVLRCSSSDICYRGSENRRRTIDSEIPQRSTCCPLYLDVGTLKQSQDRFEGVTVNLSHIWRHDTRDISTNKERLTHPCNNLVSYEPRSVISAKVRLALRCRSTLSEYTSVLSARRGSPEKKSVSARCTKDDYS